MDAKQQVLDAMKAAGKPVSAGEIASASGMDRKVVDKVMSDLKKEGSIVSPVRCKWQPAQGVAQRSRYDRGATESV